MTLSDIKIKRYKRVGSYKSDKDSKQQLYLIVRIVFAKYLNRKEERIQIKCLDKNGENIRCLKSDFSNNTYPPTIYNRIAQIDNAIVYVVQSMMQGNITLSTASIEQYLYDYIDNQQTIINKLNKGYINDPKILDQYKDYRFIHDSPLSVEAKRKFDSLDNDAFIDEDGEYVDPVTVMNNIEVEVLTKEKQEEIQKMSITERYKKGFYDKRNIFEIFGYCLSDDSKTKEPFVSDKYRSLWVRLIDYKFNGNPSIDADDLNLDWIEDFLTFCATNGYSTAKIVKCTPFNYEKFELQLIRSSREVYKAATFNKLVQIIKRWLKILAKEKMLPNPIDRDLIDATDYHGRNVLNKSRSKQEFTLTSDELKELTEVKLSGDLNKTRNTFIVQTFCSGIRGIENMIEHLKIINDNDVYFVRAEHRKTKDKNDVPLLDYLEDMVKSNNYELPELETDAKIYNDNLKRIAVKLKWDRVIREPNNDMNRTKEDPIEFEYKLSDIINGKFARKTYVNYLSEEKGLTAEEIAEFTNHKKVQTVIDNYKMNDSIKKKLRILNK